MKLRNKKTGEIVTLTLSANGEDMIIMGNDMYAHITKLSELKDYEDYKEPKKYWYIENNGDVDKEIYDGDKYEERMIEIGNYFETKEEAERAVEKLKAYKRLKDKGAKIIDYECYGGTNTKGEFSGELKVTIDVPQEVDKYLFKLLFGIEELKEENETKK